LRGGLILAFLIAEAAIAVRGYNGLTAMPLGRSTRLISRSTVTAEAFDAIRPDAAIPVSGGDFIERGGRRYAVMFDVDRMMVAAYAIAGDRLKRAPLASLTLR
jgi:hypothetical protein